MKIAKPFGKHPSSGSLRVSLCDNNPDVVDAWVESFYGVDAVEVLEGDLMKLDCHALVSPANSFGDMSGGIDKHIDDFYKGMAQEATVAAIAEQYYGELPVGMAIVLEMHSRRFPYLVVAPTMRIPGNVAKTLNAYLAFRATLVAILKHSAVSPDKIEWIAVPGLCTGVGGMAYSESARQMRTAYDNVVGGGWKEVLHPALAPYAFGSRGSNPRGRSEPKPEE